MYQQMIARLLPEGCPVPPRHIEAWMRSEHATLDGLSPARFAAEVRAALTAAEVAGPELSERLAVSYGL